MKHALQPPARIEDVGLAEFLDETSHLHNNFGYDNFVSMIGDDFLESNRTKVDKANIGRAFGVSRATIHRWLKIYRKDVDRDRN